MTEQDQAVRRVGVLSVGSSCGYDWGRVVSDTVRVSVAGVTGAEKCRCAWAQWDEIARSS